MRASRALKSLGFLMVGIFVRESLPSCILSALGSPHFVVTLHLSSHENHPPRRMWTRILYWKISEWPCGSESSIGVALNGSAAQHLDVGVPGSRTGGYCPRYGGFSWAAIASVHATVGFQSLPWQGTREFAESYCPRYGGLFWVCNGRPQYRQLEATAPATVGF